MQINKLMFVMLSIIGLAFVTTESWSQGDSEDKPENVKFLGKIQQHTDAAEFAMPFVYLSNGGRFQIYDIANPADPKMRGAIDLKTTATLIQLAGNVALVANVNGSLKSVSIANPEVPQELSSISISGKPFFMSLRKKHAYIGYQREDVFGLAIIDYSIPKALVFDGKFEQTIPVDSQFIEEDAVINVTPSGKTVLMNYWDNYRRSHETNDILVIINATNSKKPVLSRKYKVKALIKNIISTDQYAQVDYFHEHVNFTDIPIITGSMYFNISNPTSPIKIKNAKVCTSGRVRGGYHFGVKSLAVNHKMFSLDGMEYSGLLIHDISDQKHCRKIGYYPLQEFNDTIDQLWVSKNLILVRELEKGGHHLDWLDILELQTHLRQRES